VCSFATAVGESPDWDGLIPGRQVASIAGMKALEALLMFDPFSSEDWRIPPLLLKTAFEGVTLARETE